jgi:hypothetical protein
MTFVRSLSHWFLACALWGVQIYVCARYCHSDLYLTAAKHATQIMSVVLMVLYS